MICTASWDTSIPGKGNKQCTCPEVSTYLTDTLKPEYLETETGQRSEGRPAACVGLCKDLAFTTNEMGAFGRVSVKIGVIGC